MIAAALLLATGAPTASAAAPDWAAALREDARALHDGIAANHAGPVDPLNPQFAALNDRALAEALTRARRVKGYPGYLWAMRGYVARFDDGHVQIGATDKTPPIAFAWPGFLTAYDEHGAVVVRSRADDAPAPIGATLIGCDGRGADDLGRANVGAFFGRWSLASQRINQGWRLFIDAGNPFIRRPVSCTFRVDGAERRVALAWRPLPDSEWSARVGPVTRGPSAPVAARTLADGTRWYTLSSFNGDPGSVAGKALPPLIAGMAADRTAMTNAPRIVLDLRGNGGGSSDWSRQIAVILWGETAVAKADVNSAYVEWRASPDNLAFMKQTLAERSTAPQPREVTDWFTRTIAGMRSAIAMGSSLWREPEEAAAPPLADRTAPSPPPPPLGGPVYFVTDPACGSACLDAADLWRALGAIQVGAETSADTLYMDDREDLLPSGMMRADIPMKVYRDRPRGSNAPLTPVHRFPGDLRDTAALERWVVALPGDGS